MSEKNVFYVKSPSAFIYNMLNEPSDELLFGWKVTTVGEIRDGRIYCKTDYGYSGYIDANLIVCESEKPSHKVISRFCPMLEKPSYIGKTVSMLPFGSRVRVVSEEGSFCAVKSDGKVYYLPSVHISSAEKESVFPDDVINTASLYLDTPYLWGGKTPVGIDCSGLCFMAYYLNGIKIYRDARFPFYEEYAVLFEELSPGDLVFYKGHVALYIGGGKIIHSNSHDGKVTVGEVNHAGIVGCASMKKIVSSQTA